MTVKETKVFNVSTHQATVRGLTTSLSRENIARALEVLSAPVEKYLAIQRRVADGRGFHSDLKFRRQFNSFYRVRRGRDWQDCFYGLMKELQGQAVSFELCLTQLFSVTGQVESSFASKLLHTLDPNQPVIDSIVLKNLGLLRLIRKGANRIERIVGLHQHLADCYNEYLSSQEGKVLLRDFKARYTQPGVTNVKALDFILWQTRP
jgi:hypothetical protein